MTNTEQYLERIAIALESISESMKTSTPASAPSKPAPKKKKKAEAAPEKADVREALKNLQKAKGALAARDLLGENGAKTLTDLDVERYASVIESAVERAND